MGTKRRMETNSIKNTNSMNKDCSNVSKSRFDCYFRRSLVNVKNLIFGMGYLWFVIKLSKCCF